MIAPKFDFIQAYRDLDPNASRELIEARQKAHELLDAEFKDMKQVYDLCQLAFLLEPDRDNVTEWFEKPIRSLDPHFLVSRDKAEAGRIATLLLRARIARAGAHVPLAILTASFCGRRHSADADAVAQEALEALTAAVREQRRFAPAKAISSPEFGAISEVNALEQHNPLQGTVAKSALDAVVAESEEALSTLAETVEASLSSAHRDLIRLADEVDMLWWHIGDWHELLEKPRSSAAAETKMLASGIELGGLVRQLPGPYGAYGILRRISGSDADAKTTLRRAVNSLSSDDAKNLAKNIPSWSKSLFPIHAAIQSVSERGSVGWESEFVRAVPDVADLEISFFDLGIQAYRERELINYGGRGT